MTIIMLRNTFGGSSITSESSNYFGTSNPASIIQPDITPLYSKKCLLIQRSEICVFLNQVHRLWLAMDASTAAVDVAKLFSLHGKTAIVPGGQSPVPSKGMT